MVGVLAKDDHAHVFRRSQLQRPQRPGRENHGPGIQALTQKAQQLLPGDAAEKPIDQRLPARRHGPVGRVAARKLIGPAHLNNAASASPGSLARMNASPTRKAWTPAARKVATSSRVAMPD